MVLDLLSCFPETVVSLSPVTVASLFPMSLLNPKCLWKDVNGIAIFQSCALPHTYQVLCFRMLADVTYEAPPDKKIFLHWVPPHMLRCFSKPKYANRHFQDDIHLTGTRWRLQCWAAVKCRLSTGRVASLQHIETCPSTSSQRHHIPALYIAHRP